jgi:hypothetical protein
MSRIERRLITGLSAMALSWACASGAHAQTALRPYVGAAIASFSVDADEVDGKSSAPGAVVGLSVSRLVDVEFEALFPTSTFNRTTVAIGTSFAGPGASREEIERLGVLTEFVRERDVVANLSVVAVIHPPATGRVVPGLVAGVTVQRAKIRSEYTPLRIPDGVDPNDPRAIAQQERQTRNISAPTIGGQLSIRVTPQFYVVPDLRYDYGSIGDEINNTLRLSIRSIWRF